MRSPILITIGGFLGAGKTTLLAAAAEHLASRGLTAAAITNDQAGNLVDTAFLRARAIPVAEVAGGCFCCRFDQLEYAAATLANGQAPRAILAEPVGSCTDLAATVVRPWRQLLGRPAAPASVLIDPARLHQAIDPSSPGPLAPEAAYILNRQLHEADAIVLSKADTLDAETTRRLLSSLQAAFPGRPVFALSATSGRGIQEWLDFVLSPRSAAAAGERRIDVDYDIYARGEAVLGWLNARGAALVGGGGGASLALQAVRLLQSECTSRGSSIAHIKVRVECEGDAAQSHATSNDAPPDTTGDCPAGRALVMINARAQIDPPALEYLARQAFARLTPAGATVDELNCFSPGRPVPRHRL